MVQDSIFNIQNLCFTNNEQQTTNNEHSSTINYFPNNEQNELNVKR